MAPEADRTLRAGAQKRVPTKVCLELGRAGTTFTYCSVGQSKGVSVATGGKTSNCLLLLVIVLGEACARASGAQVGDTETTASAALARVEHCKTEAKRCQDYAGSPSASTVCDQDFRSCLAELVQDGGSTTTRGVTLGETAPPRACIEDVRTCLVAMSAPSTCASRAAECLEASTRDRPTSAARTDEGQPR
jgi:hypothetical protein